MNVLVACECSQVICEAFILKGHNAWSMDLQPSYGNYPDRHIIADARTINPDEWDLVIAHPPCDHTAVSGNRWRQDKEPELVNQAVDFFMFFARLSDKHKVKVCIEHPVSIISSRYRKPDQYIQPWMFGHNETKKTGLWLYGLPKLEPTNVIHGEHEQKVWRMGPGPDRKRLRSQTYQGIAEAMAEQWG